MSLNSIDSNDTVTWVGPKDVGQAGNWTKNGLGLSECRGNLWGLGTASADGSIWAIKINESNQWEKGTFVLLPTKDFALAAHRLSTTVSNDWFYFSFHHKNEPQITLGRTKDFKQFFNLGNVGTTNVDMGCAPAIAYFGGWIYIAVVEGVKEGHPPLNVTRYDPATGNWDNWTKLAGWATNAPSLTVVRSILFLTLTDSKGRFVWQALSNTTNAKWSEVHSFEDDASSAPSTAVFKDDQLCAVYRGKNGNIKWRRFDGTSWSCTASINWRFSAKDMGLATFSHRLHLSYIDAGSCVVPTDLRLEGPWTAIQMYGHQGLDYDSDEESLHKVQVAAQVARCSRERPSFWRRFLCRIKASLFP